MSVRISQGGIGFSSHTRAAYLDLGANYTTSRSIAPTKPDDSKDRSLPWSKWGSNNLLPNEMIQDIEKCHILNSIIDSKARFALCNGLLPAMVHYNEKGEMVIDKIVTDSEIVDFLEENNQFFHVYGWMKDLCGFGNGVARIMLNLGRDRIARFQRDDITEMRYEKMDESAIIKQIYLSASWDKVGSNAKHKSLVTVPLLNPASPLMDLKEKAKNTTLTEFAMTFKYPSWGRKYYGVPTWYAALKWVRIAQGVPEMKAAIFENNFRPKYMVIISERYWERVFEGEAKGISDYTPKEIAEKKQALYDEIDNYLAGNMNAYKTVFTDGYMDANGQLHPEIEIKPIEDTTKQGELLPDSAAANSEIAFAMQFNPAIIGANMPSGPYAKDSGGSNVREATLIQVIMHELERNYIKQLFAVIKRFNGWDKKFVSENSKLEFIIPATIPTTLDTGSNVKSMVTGVSPNQNNPS